MRASFLRCILTLTSMASCGLADEAGYVERSSIPTPHATQAAAMDGRFVYAVSNTTIAKLDREDGKELALSSGAAAHLNSAVVIGGKIYCAHSNFPLKPEQGDIRVLDPETMVLTIFHRFENPPGSLTWVLHHEGSWWCHFAHYGLETEKARLIRFNDQWKETGRWEYPAELVKEWGAASLSGAVWQGDVLLATGHDEKKIYRLKVPAEGKSVLWLDTLKSPFPGQGIAADLKTGGLVGIDRKRKCVVFAVKEAE